MGAWIEIPPGSTCKARGTVVPVWGRGLKYNFVG